ncbi:hypothetical protein EES43_14130 [Streptomyces sp. ADI96-02]|uniref:hypothetical protein n=1 Tax=Streptomyces sp. ADI96-02 TaxID=1522760 RepID=UPI000F551227|nr:hypothetical protein [Streptomyces sp. ADI96-02]RPK62147.1 hypothetical protein EES43_14130 [Streptomyces sp. ADI96-02]
MKRQPIRGRGTLAALAAVCAVAALPGPAHADGRAAYTFDPGAQRVRGAAANAEASVLEEGTVYRSTIGAGDKLYYRVRLDAVSNAYVSAVAVPTKGGAVAYADGITVSVRDLNDSRCGSNSADFGPGEAARPIAAYAYRTVDKGGSTCQEAGTYDVLVERESKDTSSPEPWDLELRFVREPGLRSGQSMPTEAPENWPSGTPEPPSAGGGKRSGGSGYYDAASLETGAWVDEIAPGQTLFYRVPVDWGQQIHASAVLSNSTGGATEFVGNALTLSLDNPAQGHVDGTSLSYSGKSASTALKPLPPVAYRNRFDYNSAVSAMRFAGWYYLSVTLSPKVADSYGKGPIAVTTTVQVKNGPAESPYEGDPGIFAVTDRDKDMAKNGGSAPQAAERSGTMRLVAASGIGAGTVLVLGLGIWTLVGRRRAAAVPADGPQPPVGGPPHQGW